MITYLLTLILCAMSFSLWSNPIDSNATTETKNLYANLKILAQTGIIFGHQNAEIEGHLRRGVDTSDVYNVCGKNPGVIGFDFDEALNDDGIHLDEYLKKVKLVYERGGVVTFSWHMDNPKTGGTSHDRTRAIADIIPGGKLHDEFKKTLDLFADFAKKAIGHDGKSIPIIFRPYHEHTGFWFWWRARQDQKNFVKLWRFTVEYYRDHHQLHNLLYAYSPGKFQYLRKYYMGYPGDNYVDIFGLDYYKDHTQKFAGELAMVVKEAKRKGKLAALTETGQEGVKNTYYWTNNFLSTFKNNQNLKGTSFVLFWRNASERATHYYVPYPGHHSVPDFLEMEKDPLTIFQEDFPYSLYKIKN